MTHLQEAERAMGDGQLTVLLTLGFGGKQADNPPFEVHLTPVEGQQFTPSASRFQGRKDQSLQVR